jgi:hypothetical protein
MTNCLENALIVLNTINFILYFLGFILIDKDSVKNLIYINIIPFVFLFFNILTLILVKIFVHFETIFTTQRKLCCIFAYISLFLSIFCFFFAVLVAYFCLKEINKSGKKFSDKNSIMILLICCITGFLCLIGSFFWYNLMKRIKYCVRGKMIEDKGLINYGALGAYLGRNNHKNKGKSTGRLNGSETIYVKNNMNTTRNISNLNSFADYNKKENNMNEISEQPDEESNSSNQEEEKEVKVQESIEDEF